MKSFELDKIRKLQRSEKFLSEGSDKLPNSASDGDGEDRHFLTIQTNKNIWQEPDRCQPQPRKMMKNMSVMNDPLQLNVKGK